jgi:gluconolactonase
MAQQIKVEEITSEAQRCELGEGPHWDIERQSLYYVDIVGPAIFRYDYKSGEIYKATIKGSDARLGFITPVDGTSNEFIVGADHDLIVISWDGKSGQATVVRVLTQVDLDNPPHRINDGKVDPRGRVFFGTIGDESLNLTQIRLGAFYRYTDSGTVKLKDSIGISNGLTWNEKLGKFYYIDSVARDVKVFDYDSSSGNICMLCIFSSILISKVSFNIFSANEQVLFDLSKSYEPQVMPDGMTIDENGFLYVATWNGHRVLVINPETKLVVREIEIPTDQVTSVMAKKLLIFFFNFSITFSFRLRLVDQIWTFCE